MSRVITFSRVFPSYHPRAGEPTHFVEKVLKSLYDPAFLLKPPQEFKTVGGHDITKLHLKQPIEVFDPKHHTIRAGHRWKVGDTFSPRVWSGIPYKSKQITFALDIEIKQIWDVEFDEDGSLWIFSDNERGPEVVEEVAKNDGLTKDDLFAWFNKPFTGQIICWNENINY